METDVKNLTSPNATIIVMIIILAFAGIILATKKKSYWSVYKKQYILFSVLLLVTTITGISLNSNQPIIQSIVMPLSIGLIASILYGIFNLESDPKFAQTISQEVAGIIDGTIPTKVYPASKKINGDGEMSDTLADCMCNSKSFSYSGVRMAVASNCIKNYLEEQKCDQKISCITEMNFIIPDPQSSSINKNKNLQEGMKKSLNTIIESCANASFTITVHFFILPYGPPLHIHLTDNFCFWGLVDKMNDCPCPTTYCYRKSEKSDINKPDVSMYTTIKGLVEQTMKRVTNGIGKEIIIVFGEEKKTFNLRVNNGTTYNYNYNNKKEFNEILNDIINNMRI